MMVSKHEKENIVTQQNYSSSSSMKFIGVMIQVNFDDIATIARFKLQYQ